MLNESALRALANDSRIYDLGQPLEVGMPGHPNHPPYIFTLMRRHGDVCRPHGFSSANELIVLSGHTGTHFDGLGHVSENGNLHGGVNAYENQQNKSGMKSLGIDTVPPLVARGVLLDVAGFRGISMLEGGAAITAEELAKVAERQGVTIEAGDVVLIRTGWIQQWGDPAAYRGDKDGNPGPDAGAAEWLAMKRIRATGTDTIPYEVTRPDNPEMPVHMLLIARNGIHIMEMVNLEELARDHAYSFLFVALPLKLVGGTGSPIRPIAIV